MCSFVMPLMTDGELREIVVEDSPLTMKQRMQLTMLFNAY